MSFSLLTLNSIDFSFPWQTYQLAVQQQQRRQICPELPGAVPPALLQLLFGQQHRPVLCTHLLLRAPPLPAHCIVEAQEQPGGRGVGGEGEGKGEGEGVVASQHVQHQWLQTQCAIGRWVDVYAMATMQCACSCYAAATQYAGTVA